jgi:hypothetical protein
MTSYKGFVHLRNRKPMNNLLNCANAKPHLFGDFSGIPTAPEIEMTDPKSAQRWGENLFHEPSIGSRPFRNIVSLWTPNLACLKTGWQPPRKLLRNIAIVVHKRLTPARN